VNHQSIEKIYKYTKQPFFYTVESVTNNGGNMYNMKKNEGAVSPVIGVILMVALTVILAAVIAAFVFGMSNMGNGKIVGATAYKMGNDVIVTYQGGRDAISVGSLTATATNSTDTETQGFGGLVDPGTIVTFKGYGSTPATIEVIATFTDGSDQLILNTEI
jgi:FlaG/FlaF family flagellin (archaellin)